MLSLYLILKPVGYAPEPHRDFTVETPKRDFTEHKNTARAEQRIFVSLSAQ